jgi:hypothetical protein
MIHVAVRDVVSVMMLAGIVVHALVLHAVAGVVRSTIVTVPPSGLARYQVHAADGAGARPASNNLRVHGTDVLGLGTDRVHVEVGRLRREGTLREEPP